MEGLNHALMAAYRWKMIAHCLMMALIGYQRPPLVMRQPGGRPSAIIKDYGWSHQPYCVPV